MYFVLYCTNILTTANENWQQCCIFIASVNIKKGTQNIYDGDSTQNVRWQTVGKLTSSSSGVSDYILQICLPKSNFPCKAALSWHPEMKDYATTSRTFKNSGFEAAALQDLTFIQHQLNACTYSVA